MSIGIECINTHCFRYVSYCIITNKSSPSLRLPSLSQSPFFSHPPFFTPSPSCYFYVPN